MNKKTYIALGIGLILVVFGAIRYFYDLLYFQGAVAMAIGFIIMLVFLKLDKDEPKTNEPESSDDIGIGPYLEDWTE